MEVSAKNISCGSSESGLNARVEPFSSVLLRSGSRTLRIDQLTPLCRQLIARRSILPALKPKIVPVKPVKKQIFTDGHLKPRAVSTSRPQMRVSVKDICYSSCDSDLTSDDHSSSLLPNSGCPAVRTDTHMPHRQLSVAVLSNLPVLESKYVPVKPVNQQSFTDGPPKHQVKVSVKNISYPGCVSDLNDSVEMKMEDVPFVKANGVPVKPVSRQKFTDAPPKCRVSTSNTQMKVSVKDILFPSCVSGLNAGVERPSSLLPPSGSRAVRMDKRLPLHRQSVAVCSNLPLLEPHRVPVKPVNKQSFTNGPPERSMSSPKHKTEVSVKNISFPLCESDLKAGVDRSSSLLSHSGSPAVRMVKRTPLRQHHVAAPTRLSVLKPSCVPVKPVDEPPSCWSDLKVKSHLSLPRLPGLTSRPVNKRESCPFEDEDVKMKRAQSAKSSPLLLSRFPSAVCF
ncbi:uncharacterized protein si:dkey-199f5.7 [Danio aesculapii]|uniref:uncharacterized protein si:dkey-199f5.7 n=1 Tax=Danio aesculapii TaxID=1142201 RepID=UPI0024C0BA92|nr:uncharacterized protein si:dkey-199f5.7 [Danio aesculapii]